MRELLQYLRALYQLYQNFHWRSAGENYYGDHLLYERLYTDLQAELDQVAEKTIGTSEDLEPVSDGKSTAELLSKMTSDSSGPSDFPAEAIKAEEVLLKLISSIMNDNPSDGVQNLLQAVADLHEGHLYLLKQRAKKEAAVIIQLLKLANTLDKKGLYKEADAVDKLFKSAGDPDEEWARFLEQEDKESMEEDEIELEKAKRDFEQIRETASKLDQLRWLHNAEHEANGADAINWLNRVFEEDLYWPTVNEYVNKIENALSDEAELYRYVGADFFKAVDHLIYQYISNESDDENALLQSEIDDIRKEFGPQAEELKQQMAKEQRQYEEQRDMVRHMQMPGEHEQIEIPMDPHELEEMGGEGLGSVSSKSFNYKRGNTMLVELIKLAYMLDKKAEYELANEVDAMVAEIAQRAGIKIEELVTLANELDEMGETAMASALDKLIAAKAPFKGKGEKPPKGPEHKAPKGWFDEKKKEIKKKNPDYSEKQVNMTVGDLWDNKLSDKERAKINKKYRG